MATPTLSVEAVQLRLMALVPEATAARFAGTVGAWASPPCVVAIAGPDWAEQLPAASQAATVKLYIIPGARPVTDAPAPFTDPSSVPPWKTR